MLVEMTPTVNRQVQIGNICVQWSNLEFQLSNVIWKLIGVEHQTGIMLTGMLDIKALCKTALDLATHYKAKQELITTLDTLKKSLAELLDRRNRYIHGVHLTIEGNPKILTHRGKNKGVPTDIDDDDIEKLGIEIGALSDLVYKNMPRTLGVGT